MFLREVTGWDLLCKGCYEGGRGLHRSEIFLKMVRGRDQLFLGCPEGGRGLHICVFGEGSVMLKVF